MKRIIDIRLLADTGGNVLNAEVIFLPSGGGLDPRAMSEPIQFTAGVRCRGVGSRQQI